MSFQASRKGWRKIPKIQVHLSHSYIHGIVILKCHSYVHFYPRQRKLITWKLLWAPLPGFVGRLATSHNKRCSKRNVLPVGADGFSGRNYQFLKKGDGTGRRMLHPILTATQPAFGFSLRKTARGVPALSQSYKCSINLRLWIKRA